MNLDTIINICAEYYEVSVEDIKSKKKYKEMVKARHCFIYLSHKYTTYSNLKIGEYINRDHTTIGSAITNMHHYKSSRTYIHRDIEYLESVVESLIPNAENKVIFTVSSDIDMLEFVATITHKYDNVIYEVV